MYPSEIYERPMLSGRVIQSKDQDGSARRISSANQRSASMSIPMSTFYSSEHEREVSFVHMSGPLYTGSTPEVIDIAPTTESTMENDDWLVEEYKKKNEQFLKSGELGMCNDPYCTTCPTYYNAKGRYKHSKTSEMFDDKLHNMLYGDGKGWAERICSLLYPYSLGVLNPHAKVVQQWNKFFVISCLFAVFIDPLFFFLLSVEQSLGSHILLRRGYMIAILHLKSPFTSFLIEGIRSPNRVGVLLDNKCIVLNWPMTTTIVVLRSMTDCIYFIHVVLQFRLAYIAPESRVMGSGDLVDDPRKIARNYVFGYFFVDLFIVLPLPQMIILLILPDSMGATGANYAKDLLRAAILVQYIPRLYRFLPLLAGQSPSGFVFESAWANFVINLLTYILASHVVGSCWYLFGLQRVNQCLRDACHNSNVSRCTEFIDCGHGNDYRKFARDPSWDDWKSNDNATACFGQGGFNFGIYQNAVSLTAHQNLVTRYVYSLFWGFQQISTLAGNQVPSYFVWEVLFTMAIIGIGLLLFALLIGNMQNFLQALGRRRLELSLRRRDVELWMKHRRLPEEVQRQVREAERFNWAATRGVNEEMLMENLPEDLQRDIRRHLFKYVKKVRIFQLLDEPIIDAICEKLRTKTYIKGSKILYRGGLVDKMVFIIRGKMESIGEDLIVVPLSEGDVVGEELLTWCLEHSSVYKDGRLRIPGHRLLSNRLVRCLTNVEAFVLRAADIEEVTSLFARFLRSPRVQGAIRYESPYWRGLAAKRIQVAWRYRKKRLSRPDSSSPSRDYSSRSSHPFRFQL